MSDKTLEPLSDGIKHVRGTLYLVKFGEINVVAKPDTKEKPTEYKFSNLRYLTSTDADNLHKGFGKEDMLKNRESIREQGLHNPLIGRWIVKDGMRTMQLVEGHRRHSNLDYLRRKNEKVKDASTGEYVPARDLYEYVECRIYTCESDKDCLRLSLQESRSRVNFDSEVDIRLVMQLRDCKWTDAEILDVTGEKSEWLKDIDKIIEKLADDEPTFKAVCNGDVTISGAEGLAEIEDVAVRHQALEIASEFAKEDAKKKVLRVEKDILKAKNKIEDAKAIKAEAAFTGDTAAAEQADLDEAAAAAEIKRKIDEKKATTPKVHGGHVRKGKGELGVSTEGPKALTGKKIETCYLSPLEAAIKAGGNDDDGEFLAPVELLRAFQAVVKGIREGEEEPMKIFRRYGKKFKDADE